MPFVPTEQPRYWLNPTYWEEEQIKWAKVLGYSLVGLIVSLSFVATFWLWNDNPAALFVATMAIFLVTTFGYISFRFFLARWFLHWLRLSPQSAPLALAPLQESKEQEGGEREEIVLCQYQ